MVKKFTDRTKRKFIVINIADEIGIGKTADLFNLDRKTIRNWKKRYYVDGIEGLHNKSRIHQKFTNKIPDEIVDKILELKLIHPKFSAKKIKDTLNLKCSLTTIYKKLNQNSHTTKSLPNIADKKNIELKIFTDFFVSIKKIKFLFHQRDHKFSKYIILLEERFTGITFCSFSHERTSISIAIFLEYFIEHLMQSNFNLTCNFSISSSIKLSSNDLIEQIIKDKYRCNIINNCHRSDFFINRSENPYKYLYDNLFQRFSINNSIMSFSYQIFAQIVMFNYNLINSKDHDSTESVNYKQIEKLVCESFPIITDKYISKISEIKNSTDYFSSDYSKKSEDELVAEINKTSSTILYLKDIGLKAQNKYKYDESESIYLTARSLSKFYINKIEASLKENTDLAKLQFENIVENLLHTLLGLITIYKSKGLIEKERDLLIEGIEYSTKYDFYNFKMKLLNKIVQLDVAFQNRERSLKIIKFVIKNTDPQTENHLRAKMLLGNYYKGKDEINTALKIYNHVLNRISNQYPILKIRILTTIARTCLSINRFEDTRLYCEKAIATSKYHHINNYDIKIQDHLGIYYSRIGYFEKSIQCFKKAIKLSSERKNILLLNRNTVLLADVYFMQGKYDKAISIIKSVLPSIQKIKDHETEIRSLQNISKVYLELKKYNIAEEYADKAIFLADYLKDNNQYILGLICKINIHFQKFNLKKIIAIDQIFVKMNDRIEYTSTKFIVNLISLKVEFLKLLFVSEVKKVNRLSEEKKLINIFNRINSEIEYYDTENEEKAELTFLYCSLYQYIFDHAKKTKVNVTSIEKVIKDNYMLNKKNTIELYTKLYSKIPNVLYKNRLKELEKFSKIK
ncbi:MAG: tetratricopeptide repeat protein [Candidatus Delongbacteria bacterium]|nr:tetratricopeptide repeat protein [Candidatus Delongbacteria bacterium]